MLNINIHLALYWGLMVIASVISTWGTFVSLPYEHLGQWDAIKMALPFAWVDWVFLTIAISIGNQYSLATPLQMKFGITMLKFFLIMIFTKYYLHADVSRSDVIGFVIVFGAYLINAFHGASWLFGLKVPDETPDKPTTDKPTPDKPTPDKPTPDKPTPDKPTPDKPTTDKPTPDKPTPDN